MMSSTKIKAQTFLTEKNFFLFFLWTSLIPIVLLFVVGYYVTADLLQKHAIEKQIALAEQKHGELELFIKNVEASTAAWGTDGLIRELTEKIKSGACSKATSYSICPTSLALSKYLAENKVPVNPAVEIIDILNTDGIVVASSKSDRINILATNEQPEGSQASVLSFGKADFSPELLSKERGANNGIMIHVTTPIASMDNMSLTGILLAHTKNDELNRVTAENRGGTTESYLVNKDRLMVTPSRFIPDAVLKQKVDTASVNECINHNLSFSGSYLDYRGVNVFGASVCDPTLFGTLIVETDRDEVFIEIDRLRNIAGSVLVIILVLIIAYAYLSGADIIRGARHIFPNTVSSATTVISVVVIVVSATVGISFIFSKSIEDFILKQKVSIITSLVSQQSARHLSASPTDVFSSWDTPESQNKFKDFNDEILFSFRSAAALQLFTTSGMLVWSSLQNAEIGTFPEPEHIAEAIHTGSNISGSQTSTATEIGTTSLIGVYVPVLSKDGDIEGVVEAYINTSDIVLFTHEIQRILWAGASVATILIFLLLRYTFRKRDAMIVAQSMELRGIIEGSPIGIYTVRGDGIIETANTAMAQSSGFHGARDVIGKNIFEIEYYNNSELRILIHNGFTGASFKKEIMVEISGDSTQNKYYYYYGVPLKNTDGEIEHILLMFEDITEQKKLEEEVRGYTRNLEEKVRERTKSLENDKAADEAILSSIGEGMIATDSKGNIITMNPTAEKMLGWNESEVLGKNAIAIIRATDENGDQIPDAKRICVSVMNSTKNETLTGASYLSKKNGERVPVMETATPIITHGKISGAVIVFRDITKENEIEQTRRDLLSLASHQLRTPLSGTSWLIETLKKGVHGPLNEAQAKYIDEIYRINKKMTTLVHEMLGVLRMEGDTTTVKKEKVLVHDVLNAIIEISDPAAKAKQIAMELVDGSDYIIESNLTLLQNILESIISNAINYSPQGSRVVIRVENKQNEIIVRVQDAGIGIPKDEQARLFERFYRASNAKTFDTNGTGLGLYTATMLAKKIGVRISFISGTNEGSTFSLHIPYSPQK